MHLHPLKALRNFVYPCHCPLCSLPLADQECGVCLSCLAQLPIYQSEATMGHQRLEGIRHFGRLYAAMTYHKGGCSQRLMHQYKYHGRIELANFIADLLIQSYPDWSGGYDYLLAVPMTESHLERRGYNQALLLARALSKRRGGQASDGHIIRSGDGARQSALGKYERLGNAQSSFSLHPTLGNELIGKRLLIVDDILTSGATAMAMLDVLAPLETGLVDVCVGCVAE